MRNITHGQAFAPRDRRWALKALFKALQKLFFAYALPMFVLDNVGSDVEAYMKSPHAVTVKG